MSEWCMTCGKRYIVIVTDTHIIKVCTVCRTRTETAWEDDDEMDDAE